MVAIAIPSTCIDSRSCSSLQQVTFALYQISRACMLFGVDEIVIFDVPDAEAIAPEAEAKSTAPKKIKLDEVDSEPQPASSSVPKPQNLIIAANMLQYLITPAHLRKLIFKPIGSLGEYKYAKRLPKIPGLPDSSRVIQGIAVPREKKKRGPKQKKLSKKDKRDARETPYINVGYDRILKLRNQTVPVNSQVFVDVPKATTVEDPPHKDYRVRAVTHLSQVFTESALPDGYSQTLYIPCQHYKSQRSLPLVQEVQPGSSPQEGLLLLFGHWNDVQAAVKADADMGLDDASALFDGMLPGLEKARLEDGITVTLSRL